MQSIKTVMRAIGTPDAGLDVHSVQDVADYLEYQYTSQGYKLHSTHYLGEVLNSERRAQGYRFAYILVRDGTPEPAEAVKKAK